jgi:hypothetical protein
MRIKNNSLEVPSPGAANNFLKILLSSMPMQIKSQRKIPTKKLYRRILGYLLSCFYLLMYNSAGVVAMVAGFFFCRTSQNGAKYTKWL